MIDSSTPYRPIDCGFHDRLLHHATRRDTLELVIDEGGIQTKISTVIEDVYTQSGAEFARLADGRILRLDQILGLGGDEPLRDGFCRMDA